MRAIDPTLRAKERSTWDKDLIENPAETLMPPWVRKAIKKFVLDKSTGNVTLNIKEGRILGIRTETLTNPPKT